MVQPKTINLTKIFILSALAAVVSTSCAGTQKRWGHWIPGTWEDSGKDFSSITIYSSPPDAQIFLNNALIGNTPNRIRLPYKIQSRENQRALYEDRTNEGEEIAAFILGAMTLGGGGFEPTPHTRKINEQTSSESRKSSQSHRIKLIKKGYIPKILEITVPNDGGKVIKAELTRLQQYWSPWEVGNWQVSHKEIAGGVRIESVPSSCEIYIGRKHVGHTPKTIDLKYTVQKRTHERLLWLEIYSEVINDIELTDIDRQTRSDSRSLEKSYTITLRNKDFFSKSFEVIVPRDQGKHFRVELTRREELVVGPVEILKEIKRDTGPFRTLRKVLFSNAIREEQYPLLTKRIRKTVQTHLNESGHFMRVSLLDDKYKRKGDARLDLQIELNRKEIIMGGTLRSDAMLGNQIISRHVQFPQRDIETQLRKKCEELVNALMNPYAAVLPNEER